MKVKDTLTSCKDLICAHSLDLFCQFIKDKKNILNWSYKTRMLDVWSQQKDKKCQYFLQVNNLPNDENSDIPRAWAFQYNQIRE